MSYILDALRKSDQQRHRGEPPALLAAPPAASTPPRRLSMTHGLLATGLLAAGVGIGILRPWQAKPPEPMAAAKKPVEPPVKSTPAPVGAVPERKPARAVQAQKPTPTVKPAAPPAKPAKPNEFRTLAKAAPTPETAPAAAKAPAQSEVARPDPNAQRALSIAELPLSIQQELPKLSISVHAYSGLPKDRLVGINGRMLREGEYVSPGLLLEQITLDGMVMSYKGYRFQRGVR